MGTGRERHVPHGDQDGLITLTSELLPSNFCHRVVMGTTQSGIPILDNGGSTFPTQREIVCVT